MLTPGRKTRTLQESCNPDDYLYSVSEAGVEQPAEGLATFHRELLGGLAKELSGALLGYDDTSIWTASWRECWMCRLTLARGMMAKKLNAKRRPASQLR